MRERKIIVRASYSCHTFCENQQIGMQFCLRSAIRPDVCGKWHSQNDRTIDVKRAFLKQTEIYNFINIELTCATIKNSDMPVH